jgi:uncharacterized protein
LHLMKTRAITVRLDAEDERLLAEAADRLGVRAGTLARMLIRGALRGDGAPPRLLVPGSQVPVSEAPAATLAGRRDRIREIAARHGAHNVRVFGSAARGEGGAESDLDLLVEMEAGRGLLDVIALSQELERELGRKVDVVTDGGLSPHLRERIGAEAVAL